MPSDRRGTSLTVELGDGRLHISPNITAVEVMTIAAKRVQALWRNGMPVS